MSVKSVVNEARHLTYQKNECQVDNLLACRPTTGVQGWGGFRIVMAYKYFVLSMPTWPHAYHICLLGVLT